MGSGNSYIHTLIEGEPEDSGLTSASEKSQRRTVRNVLLGFSAAFVVIAIFCGAFIVNLANSFNSKTHAIDQAFPDESFRPPAVQSEGPKPINILVLGSDNVGTSGSQVLEAGDHRSDTIMWVNIPSDRKGVYIMSVMRDTWVKIPGHGNSKINAALAEGGVPLVVRTLETMFGNRVDHVTAVELEGFKAATNAIGGVEVNVPKAFTYGDFQYHAGPQLLDGDRALGFVRERHSFVDGDYQRVRDQQIFVEALLGKILSTDTLANPAKVTALVDQVSSNISVDSSLDAAVIAGLAYELRALRSSDVHTFTLPNLGTGWSPDGQQSIVLNDEAAVADIGAAMASNSLGAYLAARTAP